MKFTCEREVVLHEIANAYEIISVRNSLSILSNVLLDVSDQKLTIRATDLKVNYESTIPVEVKQPGSVTVFCDKLHSILRSLPDGEVEMELLGEHGVAYQSHVQEHPLPAQGHLGRQVPAVPGRCRRTDVLVREAGPDRDDFPHPVRGVRRRDPVFHERRVPGEAGRQDHHGSDRRPPAGLCVEGDRWRHRRCQGRNHTAEGVERGAPGRRRARASCRWR